MFPINGVDSVLDCPEGPLAQLFHDHVVIDLSSPIQLRPVGINEWKSPQDIPKDDYNGERGRKEERKKEKRESAR